MAHCHPLLPCASAASAAAFTYICMRRYWVHAHSFIHCCYHALVSPSLSLCARAVPFISSLSLVAKLTPLSGPQGTHKRTKRDPLAPELCCFLHSLPVFICPLSTLPEITLSNPFPPHARQARAIGRCALPSAAHYLKLTCSFAPSNVGLLARSVGSTISLASTMATQST